MNEWAIDELVEYGHADLSEQIEGESDPDARELVRESAAELPADVAEWAADPVVEPPSGWSYRESQENGDQVDCR